MSQEIRPVQRDPDEGPQQGSETLADDPNGLYGEGPQQGLRRISDLPNNPYGTDSTYNEKG